MKRADQIKAALEILSEKAQHACPISGKVEVDDALAELFLHANDKGAREFWKTADAKKELAKYRAGLVSAQTAYKTFPSAARFMALTRIDFKAEIARCDKLLKTPTRAAKRSSNREQAAATAAYCLLVDWGQKPSRTRGGRWCRLSAVLYGNPSADFYQQCRKVAARLETKQT